MTLDLDTRTGWPVELRLFLDRYPRDVWPDHANLGEMARFWLSIHNGFRDLGGALGTATGEFREGRVTPDEFRAWFAPRLRMFLSHLNGHHQIEDFHFFPLLGRAEPRLLLGFEVLESDHETIHQAMVETQQAGNALLQAAITDDDALRLTGDGFATAADLLLKRLTRHLEDEEDLIIPLILDRTEQALGMV
jgi:hemerythrin-like domain-containing protein